MKNKQANKKQKFCVDSDNRISYFGIYPGSFGRYLLDIADSPNYVDRAGRVRRRVFYSDVFYVLEGSHVIDCLTSTEVLAHPDYKGKAK